jgi:superfamily I DNA/RNA helicase
MDEFFIDYMKLDDFQRQLIDRRLDKSMVVTGSAGSGKSVIALHKAKQVAQSSNNYTIIVFTKTLEKYFSDGIGNLGLNNVFHYHGWRKQKQKVKYLIVDEIQDFSKQEIEELRQHGEIFFFFGDTAQSIMSFRPEGTQNVEDTAHDMKIEYDKLYFNYRLTIENALVAEKIIADNELHNKCKRHGAKPQLLSLPSFDAQLDEIIKIVQNSSLTSVGILMPFNTTGTANSRVKDPKLSVEYVHNYLLNKGITNEYKYTANQETAMDLDFHSSNMKIMTWHCAKGLQFTDVFVPGCIINAQDRKSSLFVALTRCCERLYVLHSNNLSTFFDQVNPDYWANNEEIEEI